MTDRPDDTPESLRALADRLSPEPGVFAYRDGDLKLIVETLHRAADRLEAPSNAAELVRAVDAARRAGAEEMRAAAAATVNADAEAWWGNPEDYSHSDLKRLAARVATLPLPGDQP